MLSVSLVALHQPHREASPTPTRHRIPCLFRQLQPLPTQWKQTPPTPGCPSQGLTVWAKIVSTMFSIVPVVSATILYESIIFPIRVSALRASLQVSACKGSILMPHAERPLAVTACQMYMHEGCPPQVCHNSRYWCPPILDFPLLPCTQCPPHAWLTLNSHRGSPALVWSCFFLVFAP